MNNTWGSVCMYTQMLKQSSEHTLGHSHFVSFFASPLLQLILMGRRDLSPAPDWLRTLSSVMSYLDCGLNPLIYCSHQDFREAGLALLWTNRKPSSEPVLTSITKRVNVWGPPHCSRPFNYLTMMHLRRMHVSGFREIKWQLFVILTICTIKSFVFYTFSIHV